MYPKPIERPKSVPSTTTPSKAPVTSQRPVTSNNDIQLKHDQAKKVKTSTIADKLKLSLAKSATSPERNPSPKKRVALPTTPRVVVKEVATPKKKATPSNNKSFSLMVTKLWRGLTRDDILEYFGKFGKILNDQMPEVAKDHPEGYKYLFLKFSDATAVDKALGELT
jgi:RNA recognition motif-containing protein